MANTNDFLTFATGVGANVETQSSYAADTLRTQGHQAGRANSANFNKGLSGALVLVVAVWIGSGIYRVDAQERAVI